MALCACRKSSPWYCFTHQKHVCADCFHSSHDLCYIKSYREWLEDGDFPSPVPCSLCNSKIVDENHVRLPCFHLFHRSCMQHHYESDVECPQCSGPVMPREANTVLADQVRAALMKKEPAVSPDHHDTATSAGLAHVPSAEDGSTAMTSMIVSDSAGAAADSGGLISAPSSRKPRGDVSVDIASLNVGDVDADDDKYGEKKSQPSPIATFLQDMFSQERLPYTLVGILVLLLVVVFVVGVTRSPVSRRGL
eukprot:TRINITY_DN8873_c0_g1_i3.p1 TRINITY_DN8873_c0_g1~~TRINITY_DN8873_c0_g1_i3.p1  ORF type:complete len:250 (+),score=22.99 TRINITY_DN8873_c0_g1_i3:91-840(+)